MNAIKKPIARHLLLGVGGMLASVALIASGTASANAATIGTSGQTSGASTTANVLVNSSISLTGLTGSFTLTGDPNSVVEVPSLVTMNVQTNNQAGYSVSVSTASTTLTPGIGSTNPDSIPIANLMVKETGTSGYTSLSSTSVTVHQQATRSVTAGDVISNDFKVIIPFVNSDNYSASLDYVATTL